MTDEQIKQLCKESYEQGQIDGIELACCQVAKAILEYKEKIISEWKKTK